MSDTLLEFPCDFPIRIMGVDTPAFRELAQRIVDNHVSGGKPEYRPSRDGKYVAVRYVLPVDSREQLDALYQELSDNPDCLFVL